MYLCIYLYSFNHMIFLVSGQPNKVGKFMLSQLYQTGLD